jgi:hypothetical protein
LTGKRHRAARPSDALSAEPYAAGAADARVRGWPVAEAEGGKHLDVVRRPAAVATALLDLERAMWNRA